MLGQKKCGSRKTLVQKTTWSDNNLDLKIFKFDWSEKNLSLKNSAVETYKVKKFWVRKKMWVKKNEVKKNAGPEKF